MIYTALNVSQYPHELKKIMDMYQGSWFESFLTNVLIYSVLIIPGWLLIKYYKKRISSPGGVNANAFGPFSQILKCCIVGGDVRDDLELAEEGMAEKKNKPIETDTSTRNNGSVWRVLQLIFCIAGLQASYLTWGVIQERVITKSYDGEKFTESQFLVFANRVLALIISGIVILITNQPQHIPPFYKYSYSSLSNIISSWCQYEALKFISFPTQVLAKSCKVIPVMIMGKIVSNKTYPLHEYLTALMISMGVSLFLLAAKPSSDHHSNETEITGVIILCGYLVFDSFTSNWQSELFTEYKMSPLQMMFGTNCFSFLFTSFSLLTQGTLFTSMTFLISHFDFFTHVLVLSVCSAIGQLFIFYTVSSFGPVVFTLIMTTRQAVSIILSCIVYGHVLSIAALCGVVIVFLSILLRVYLKQKDKK